MEKAGEDAALLRRCAEEALGALDAINTRLGLAFGSTTALWDWDIPSGELLLSASWRAALGYDAGAAPQSLEGLLSLVHADDRAVVEASLTSVGVGTYVQRFRMCTIEGNVRWVLARGFATAGPDGEMIRLTGTLWDMTDWVEAEELIREASDDRDRMQRLIIASLVYPVIQVRDDVLCVPLAGPIDANRAAELTEVLLQAVETHHPRFVTLDFTAAHLIDTLAAKNVLGAADAIRLMGVTSLFSGLSRELARVFLDLSPDGIEGIKTYRTLAAALAATASGRLGR